MSKVEKLQQDRAEAEADRVSHADELVALRAQLATVSDDGIAKLDDAIRIAQVRHDRAAARVEAADAAMPDAEAADAKAAQTTDEARAAVAAAIPKAVKLHAEIVKRVREYAALVASVDQQVTVANRLNGDDGEHILTVEAAIRVKQARPRKVLSDRTFERWFYESTGGELPDEDQGKVRRSSDDPRRGHLQTSNAFEIRSVSVVLRRRRYIEFLLPDRPQGEPSIASRISIPPLAADGAAWFPPRHDTPFAILAALEAERPADTRVPELEVTDVSDGGRASQQEGTADEAA